MRETRAQKIQRQRVFAAGRAADRAIDPIRAAIDAGELVITPAQPPSADAVDPHAADPGTLTTREKV